MLREAFLSPARGEDAVETLIVASALLFLAGFTVPLWLLAVAFEPFAAVLAPIALAPVLLLRGYDVRVVRAGIVGDDGCPPFRRLRRAYRDGVASSVISVVYLFPAALAVGAGVWIGLTGAVGPDGIPIGNVVIDATTATGAAYVAAGCLLVGSLYLRPAGLARFAARDRLRDAFHPIAVLRIAFRRTYAVAWLFGGIVTVVGTVFVMPFLLLGVGVAGLFLVRAISHSAIGRGAAASLDVGDVRSEIPLETSDTTEAITRTGASETTDESHSSARDREGEPTKLPVQIAPEADPAVQTGRSVPLTATDIISAAAVIGSDPVGSGSGSEDPETDDESGTKTDGDQFVWARVRARTRPSSGQPPSPTVDGDGDRANDSGDVGRADDSGDVGQAEHPR